MSILIYSSSTIGYNFVSVIVHCGGNGLITVVDSVSSGAKALSYWYQYVTLVLSSSYTYCFVSGHVVVIMFESYTSGVWIVEVGIVLLIRNDSIIISGRPVSVDGVRLFGRNWNDGVGRVWSMSVWSKLSWTSQ